MIGKDEIRSLIGRTPMVGNAARSVYKSSTGRQARRSLKKMLVRLGVVQTKKPDGSVLPPSFSSAGPVPATTEGTVRISLYGPHSRRSGSDAPSAEPLHHRHVWVQGPNYGGMEDNDLRGFVDGRYVAGWNQPGQVHVRLGRKPESWARYGDCELFRVLHRWSDVWLPGGAVVTRARLELDVETGNERALEILLYQVLKDWEPGSGGLERNNNSAPAGGEVWWNEARHETKPWGLPGAGFASDTHPDADTREMPLAMAQYRPGSETFTFESPELTKYVNAQIGQRKPLLFLLKLSDYLEDVPGTCIDVYSSNHGDSRNSARRPRLILDWMCENEVAQVERSVRLEHGRSLNVATIEDDFSGIAVSFESTGRGEEPTVNVRRATDSGDESWESIYLPGDSHKRPLEIRIDGHKNPVLIGAAFTAELRDTWVPAGAPEDQDVHWVFISPSGEDFTETAEYRGDSCWSIRFLPEELGRWQYRWFHHFTKSRYDGPIGSFDVVPGDRENALRALNRLVEKMKGSDVPPGEARACIFSTAFNRLQRALMRFETPESFPLRSDEKDGGSTGRQLDEAREVLGGIRPRSPRLDIDRPRGVER